MSGDALLFDTNAIIALFGGEKRVARIMSDSRSVGIPAVVCGELEAGMQGVTARERREREFVDGLLALPKVCVIPVTRKTGEFYGRIYDYLRSVGRKIPVNDIWIAAAALETGAAICTSDTLLLGLPLIRTVPV